MTKRNNFRQGDIVRTVFGQVKEVMDAYGCQVFFWDGEWSHPSKCIAIRSASCGGVDIDIDVGGAS